MTITEFNSLSDHDKYDITFNQGTFVEYFVNENKRYALYSLFNFYSEVEYNSIDNKIIKIRCFNDGELLDKYCFLRKGNS